MAKSTFFGWLSHDPPILIHSGGDDNDVGHHLPDETIYRFVTQLWHKSADDLVAYHERWKSLRPNHRLIHLANDFRIGREVAARGIPVVYATHNFLLDESIYNIQDEILPMFDAVYNARMTEFKRHELLAEVPKALLIGGVVTPQDSKERYEALKKMLPRATFTYDDRPYLVEEEVACELNTARVGVCLSAIEGGMYSATEYLLCGLPVVSTPSLGGRDVWFDPRFTRIVPPRPDAVAAAVQELIDLNIDPHFVRNETLARIVEQRRAFCAAGQEIYLAEVVGRDFTRDFYAGFRNKGGDWRHPESVMEGWRS
ncbi:MAG: glycosyltransferase [Planctomycetaceae bacterium]